MRRQISEVVKKEQGDGGVEARTPYTGGKFLGAGKRNTHPHAHKSTHKHTYAHMSTHVCARARMCMHKHTQAHLSTHKHAHSPQGRAGQQHLFQTQNEPQSEHRPPLGVQKP